MPKIPTKTEKIAVIGGGAWGTALATRLAARHEIILWTLEKETADNINQYHENKDFLPHIPLSKKIRAVNDFSALSDCQFLFFVPPVQFFRATLREALPSIAENAFIISCSKGIEEKHIAEKHNNIPQNNIPQNNIPQNNIQSGALISEIIAQEGAPTPPDFAILSGPSFARETAQNLPVALTLASYHPNITAIAKRFSQPQFQLHPSNDPIGVQLCGAIKNIIAIACGIIIGKNLGQNARAALITRALTETTPLIQKMGGQKNTLLSLAGIGDIILTSTSDQSRNTSLGIRLGKGESLNNILQHRKAVSEGVWTARSLRRLAEKHHITLPLCFATDDVLQEKISVDECIKKLLS